MKKKIEKKITNVVMKIAVNASYPTSLWGIYQPQEPTELLRKIRHKVKTNQL